MMKAGLPFRALFVATLLALVAGCATPRPFLAPILKDKPQSLGHYVGSRIDRAAPVIESGSAARGEARFNPDMAGVCRRSTETMSAVVSICAQEALEDDSLQFWIEDFAAALETLNARVFGDAPRIHLDVTLFAAGPSEKIDFVRRAPFDGATARLSFVTRTTLLREPFRRVVSQSFAHETYHAIPRARRLLAGETPRRGTVTAMLLEEGAAELYGLCGSLLATNLASRAEANHDFRGRPGGVFLDAELRAMLLGDFDVRKPALSRAEIDVAAEMIATTLWSHAIGPRTIAEADRDDGRALLALCTQENLGDEARFRALLARHAEDGVEAAPLPPFEGSVAEDYFRRYREAIARWRASHGLSLAKPGA